MIITSDRRGVCVCESTKWSGDACDVEVIENVNQIPPALKWLGYIMVGINFFAVLCCAIWLRLHWYTPQVRVAQPFFLFLVLIGCLISTSTIIVLAQESLTVSVEDGILSVHHACAGKLCGLFCICVALEGIKSESLTQFHPFQLIPWVLFYSAIGFQPSHGYIGELLLVLCICIWFSSYLHGSEQNSHNVHPFNECPDYLLSCFALLQHWIFHYIWDTLCQDLTCLQTLHSCH